MDFTLIAMAVLMAVGLLGSGTDAADKLLEETVNFTGELFFADKKIPALVIGAVRDGEVYTAGFGAIAPGSERAPDGDTLVPIGSVTKVFTGAVLASMAVDGKVKLTDLLEGQLNWGIKIPEANGSPIRLIHLATHTSGLPREITPPPLSATGYAKEDFIFFLKNADLLYAPGSGALYSNVGFNLLGQALAGAAGKPYDVLLQERVLGPIGLNDTGYWPDEERRKRVLEGFDFDGKLVPYSPAEPMSLGASGLYSSANDLLRWLAWHLDRFSNLHAEMRLLDHAAYVQRDGLKPVYGLDESGRMDAMGLGWIIMSPDGFRPLLLQKAGGSRGVFSYVVFAPTRGVGVFMAINQFDLGAALEMAAIANELVTTLSPR